MTKFIMILMSALFLNALSGYARANPVSQFNSDTWINVSSAAQNLYETTMTADFLSPSSCLIIGNLYGSAAELGKCIVLDAKYWKFKDNQVAQAVYDDATAIQIFSSIPNCNTAKSWIPKFKNQVKKLSSALDAATQYR